MLRNSRLILAINGMIMITLGGAFWIFPDFFNLLMFPKLVDNREALDVGIALRKNMGAGTAFIGLMLFWCQNSSKFIAQRLLLCCAFGFLMLAVAVWEVRYSGQADSPIAIIVLFFFLSLLSLYVGTRRYQE